MPCEDKNRDQGDAAEAKEYQRLPANHQKLGRGIEGFLNGFRKSMVLLTSWFQMSDLQDCKANSVALSHPVCGTLFWQPQETNAPPEDIAHPATLVWEAASLSHILQTWRGHQSPSLSNSASKTTLPWSFAPLRFMTSPAIPPFHSCRSPGRLKWPPHDQTWTLFLPPPDFPSPYS